MSAVEGYTWWTCPCPRHPPFYPCGRGLTSPATEPGCHRTLAHGAGFPPRRLSRSRVPTAPLLTEPGSHRTLAHRAGFPRWSWWSTGSTVESWLRFGPLPPAPSASRQVCHLSCQPLRPSPSRRLCHLTLCRPPTLLPVPSTALPRLPAAHSSLAPRDAACNRHLRFGAQEMWATRSPANSRADGCSTGMLSTVGRRLAHLCLPRKQDVSA